MATTRHLVCPKCKGDFYTDERSSQCPYCKKDDASPFCNQVKDESDNRKTIKTSDGRMMKYGSLI